MRVIKTDDFDDARWREALDASPMLNSLWSESHERNAAYPDVLADVFQLLYQALPAWMVGTRPTLQEYLLREIANTQEFSGLRALAVDDAANATMASGIIGRRVLGSSVNDLAEVLADEAQRETALQEAEAHVAALRQFEQESGGEADADADAVAATLAAAESVLAQAMQDREELPSPESFEEAIGKVRRAAREAALAAGQALGRLAEAEGVLGAGAGTSIEAKLRLAERLERSPKLAQLVEMAGRIRRIALAKRASVLKAVSPEVVGVGIGADVALALPSELALLTADETRPVFYRKLVERQLLQFEQRGEERLGGGPIVVLLDGSGSMAGQRETWSKAVALGFLAIAERERRDLCICQFGGAGQQRVHEFRYRTRPREVSRERVLEAVDLFLDAGATDLQGPLRWAAAYISEVNSAMATADVVVLTDAEVTFSAAFLDWWHAERRRLGVYTFGVLIGASAAVPLLAQAIEHVVTLPDLADDSQALTALFGRRMTPPAS